MKYQLFCALSMASLLVACGGSGSSDNNEETQQPNIATQGMITGFGSVIVNGIHYDVANADIEMDDESLVESQLEVGQIVRITGSIDDDGINGTALKVEGETQLRGPIESIESSAGVIIALGQIILVNSDTFYTDGLTLDVLQIGDVIKVSGYTNIDGEIVATRIDLKNDVTGNSFGFSGTVENLDTTALTFMINNQLIDYSNVTLANLPNSTLENGMMVRVHGSLVDDIFVAVGNLRLSHLGFKHQHDDDDLKIEISGLINTMETIDSFYLGDVLVIMTTGTEIKNGSFSQLEAGVHVKVEGNWNADGNLLATEIKLSFKPHINSKGVVDAIDPAGNNITVNGAVYEITPETSFNDRSHTKVRFFDLQDVTVGDFVHVRGYRIAATTTTAERLIATRIERHNPRDSDNDDDFTIEIEGIINAVNDSIITVAGHDITLNELTMFEGFTDLTQFLATAVGAEVEVKAIIEDGVIIAVKVELESDDSDVNDHD